MDDVPNEFESPEGQGSDDALSQPDDANALVRTGPGTEAPIQQTEPEPKPEAPQVAQTKLPSWDEFKTPAKLPTWDEFKKPDTALKWVSDQGFKSDLIDGAKEALSDPAVNLFGISPVGKVSQAFGNAFMDSAKESLDQPFLSPEVSDYFKKAGIFTNYLEQKRDMNNGFMNAYAVPAARTGLSYLSVLEDYALVKPLRAAGSLINAGMSGLASGVTEAAHEIGREAFGEHGGNILAAGAETVMQTPEFMHVGTGYGAFKPALEQMPMPAPIAKAVASGAAHEEVWDGRAQPTEAQAKTMDAAAAQVPPEPPNLDVHTVARILDPETFTEYDDRTVKHEIYGQQLRDATAKRQADAEANAPHNEEIANTEAKLENATPRKAKIYQARLDDLQAKNEEWIAQKLAEETPELTEARQRYLENFNRMGDLSPHVSAAYRDAESRMPARDEAFEEVPEPESPVIHASDESAAPEAGTEEALKRERDESKKAYDDLEARAGKGEVIDKKEAQDAQLKAVEAQSNLARFMASRDETLIGKEPTRTPEEQRAAIVQAETQKLTAAGRPPEEAESAAQLIADHYQARSARFKGQRGAAEEMYERDSANIRAGREKAKARELAQKDKPRELEQKPGHNAPDLFKDILDKAAEREKLADELARPGRGVKLVHEDGRTAMAGPDMSKPGTFRLTRFDKDGPVGHTEHATLKEAISEGLKNKYFPQNELFQKAQGKIRLATDNAKAIITLFKTANASTFIHETGHHWLDELLKDAAHPLADDGLRKDAETVKKWLGTEGNEITTRQHEKFARGFERYMMEGVAPSKGLASVFAKFRDWLTKIYQTVDRLKSPINDDIRGVFDRLLAEKPEKTVIAEDRPIAKTMADIHEADAELTPPQHAAEARDNVAQEIPLGVKDYGEIKDAIERSRGTGQGPESGKDAQGNEGAEAGPEGSGSSAPRSQVIGGAGEAGQKGTGLQPEKKSLVLAKVPREPLSLSAYVKKLGGVKDAGGDILHTIGEKKQFYGLIKEDGRELDDMAEKAWLDGYFPEKGDERPSINEFLEKLETDIKGAKQYSAHEAGKLKDYQDAVRHNEDIQRIADDLGITTFKSAKEFWDEVANKTSEAERDRLAEELTSHLNDTHQDMLDAERDRLDAQGDREPEPDSEPVTEEDLENEREQERRAAEAQGRGTDSQEQRATGNQGQGATGSRQGGGNPDADRPEGPNTPSQPASDLVDKAGNIRLENLTDQDSVRNAMMDAYHFAPEKFTHDTVTDTEISSLAQSMGVADRELNLEALKDAARRDNMPLAARIKIARQMLVEQAKVARDAMAKAGNGTTEDLKAFADARQRFLMIAESVSMITNEWGRAGRAFRDISHEEITQAEELRELFQNTTGMTENEIRKMAQEGGKLRKPGQAAQFIQDSQKPDFGDKIVWYRVNALISGPFTHARYAVGNFLNAVVDPLVKTPVAATIGALRGDADRVYFGEIGAQMFAIGKGSTDGLRAAVEAWKDNLSPPLPGERQMVHRGFQPTSTIGKIYGTPGRSVSAIHSFFKSLRYEQNIQALAYRQAMSEGLNGAGRDARIADLTMRPTQDMMDLATNKDPLRTLAYEQGVKEGLTGGRLNSRMEELQENPTPEMKELATKASIIKEATGESLKQVYMAPTNYDSFLGRVGGAINQNAFVKCMIPFMKIGTQIEAQALLEGTPLGLANKSIRDNLLYRNGGAKGDMAVAKAGTGVALMGATVYLASQGKLTGDGPMDPTERKTWLLNHKPNSITIGDITLPYKGLGYLGMQMRFAANMYETAHYTNDDDRAKLSAAFLESFTKSILEDNWMYGISQALDAVYHPQEYGERYIKDFAASWMPWSVGMNQTARQVDPYMRDAKDMFDVARSKIPFASEGLYPRIDSFGNPVKSGGNTDLYKNDPVVQRMENLGIGIGKIDRTIMNVQLTDKQYMEYCTMAGRYAKMQLTALVTQKDFDQIPPGIQIKEIHSVITQARKQARGVMLQNYPNILIQAQDERQKVLMQGKRPQ